MVMNGALGIGILLLSLCHNVSAQALATITPCPQCPASIQPPPITVTSQLQPVSTCVPATTCRTTSSQATCQTTASCQTSLYLSTTVSSSSGGQVITATDQIVTVRRISAVFTSVSPCPVSASGTNPLVTATTPACTPRTALQTYVENDTAPFSNIGDFIIPGYGGSGLCRVCGPDANGNKLQPVHVSACLDSACTEYDVVLVSATSTSTSSTATTAVSTQVSGSSGVNNIAITTVITPTGGAFSQPVTTVISLSTSLSAPQAISIFQNIIVTFTTSLPGGIAQPPGSPSIPGLPNGFPFQLGNPGDNFGISNGPVTGNNYGISNGPVSGNNFGINSGSVGGTNFGINNGGSGSNFGTSNGGTQGDNFGINNGGNINGNNFGINNGGTVSGNNNGINTGGNIGGSNNGINNGGSGGGGGNGGITTFTTQTLFTTTPVTTAGSPTSALTTTGNGGVPDPTPNPVVAQAELEGCFRGSGSFTFNDDTPGMTNEICVRDCRASGFLFSGVAITDCYCSDSLDESGDLVRVSLDQCNTPCPGDPAQFCGGYIYNTQAKKAKRRLTGGVPIIVAYSQTEPIPSSTTAATTEPTPDPSSDPEADPVQRRSEPTAAVTAELNHRSYGPAASPSRRGLRLGGQIQAKREVKSAIMVKRDFGLRQLFGLE